MQQVSSGITRQQYYGLLQDIRRIKKSSLQSVDPSTALMPLIQENTDQISGNYGAIILLNQQLSNFVDRVVAAEQRLDAIDALLAAIPAVDVDDFTQLRDDYNSFKFTVNEYMTDNNAAVVQLQQDVITSQQTDALMQQTINTLALQTTVQNNFDLLSSAITQHIQEFDDLVQNQIPTTYYTAVQTNQQIDNKIAAAQLAGQQVDLSAYSTIAYTDSKSDALWNALNNNYYSKTQLPIYLGTATYKTATQITDMINQNASVVQALADSAAAANNTASLTSLTANHNTTKLVLYDLLILSTQYLAEFELRVSSNRQAETVPGNDIAIDGGNVRFCNLYNDQSASYYQSFSIEGYYDIDGGQAVQMTEYSWTALVDNRYFQNPQLLIDYNYLKLKINSVDTKMSEFLQSVNAQPNNSDFFDVQINIDVALTAWPFNNGSQVGEFALMVKPGTTIGFNEAISNSVSFAASPAKELLAAYGSEVQFQTFTGFETFRLRFQRQYPLSTYDRLWVALAARTTAGQYLMVQRESEMKIGIKLIPKGVNQALITA